MAIRTIPPSSYLYSGGDSMEKVTQWVAAVLQERLNVPSRHSREGTSRCRVRSRRTRRAIGLEPLPNRAPSTR